MAVPAIPIPGGPRPAWPTAAPSALEPSVVLAFLVDTTGKADTTSLPVRVIAASDSGAAAAARAVLPEWRFMPAQVVPGCKVAQLVQLPFGRVPTPK